MKRLQSFAWCCGLGMVAVGCGPDGQSAEGTQNAIALAAAAVPITCPSFTPPVSAYTVALQPDQYCECAREGFDMEALCDDFVDVYLDPAGDPAGTGEIDDPVTTLKDAERVCLGGMAPCHIRIAEGTYPLPAFATDGDAAETPGFADCLWIEGALSAGDYAAGGGESVLSMEAYLATAVVATNVSRVENVTLAATFSPFEAYGNLGVRTAALFDNVTVRGTDRLGGSNGLVASGAGPFYFCDVETSGTSGGIGVSQATRVVVEGATIDTQATTDASSVGVRVSESRGVVIASSSMDTVGGPASSSGPEVGISLAESADVYVLGADIVSDYFGVYTYEDSLSNVSTDVHIEGNTVTVPDSRQALPEANAVRNIVLVNNTVIEGAP